jgi:hypothetical protein
LSSAAPQRFACARKTAAIDPVAVSGSIPSIRAIAALPVI